MSLNLRVAEEFHFRTVRHVYHLMRFDSQALCHHGKLELSCCSTFQVPRVHVHGMHGSAEKGAELLVLVEGFQRVP